MKASNYKLSGQTLSNGGKEIPKLATY
ncbi:Protein of unknown function [Lactobacillus helveticus CIRM-BIA 953]|uniref:Uncharacterized protein n=1 Tax=Lactobacillus helveticus CIRM-BIA 953 TaxID=1226335 RepID=U4QDU8_LACHE|nr:Protein of unknown function [Lactobacillus helveticus CIRM-BIA 953]